MHALKAQNFLSTLLLLLTGCGGPVMVGPPKPQLTDPQARPASPLTSPEAGAESINTEYYLGTAEDERKMFERFGKEMQTIQKKQAEDNKQAVQRGFHAKHHGCLQGRLRLLPNRDPRTRFGIFAGPRADFPIWARFSNGVGWRQKDGDLDARGIAVKVMEIEGPKLIDAEEKTQDFLMTNSPVPIGRNAVHFMRFARANAQGFWSAIWFAVTHPVSGLPGVSHTSTIDDMVTEQYWSGAAYHLGAHQAIKYTVKACRSVPVPELASADLNYLRARLKVHAAKGLCFRFYVQFQTDPESTPIEDASVTWTEDDSPLVAVAELHLPAQDIDEAGRMEFCRQLTFNPWHSIAAHQPMGHINRARRYVYSASAKFRKSGGEPLPYATTKTSTQSQSSESH